MDWTEIIIAALGVTGTIGAAWIGQFQVTKARRKGRAAEHELNIQRSALDFATFTNEWQEFNHDLRALLDETEIDRFLILRAWNGELSPQWTTATFQVRESTQQVYQYIHFQLDADYVERLRRTVANGSIQFDVRDTDGPSAINDVYEMEGVKSSAWFHIASHDIDDYARAISYCSFASQKGTITKETMVKCRMLVSRLKGIAMSFET